MEPRTRLSIYLDYFATFVFIYLFFQNDYSTAKVQAAPFDNVRYVCSQAENPALLGQGRTIGIHVCMPKSCSEQDIQHLFTPSAGKLLL